MLSGRFSLTSSARRCRRTIRSRCRRVGYDHNRGDMPRPPPGCTGAVNPGAEASRVCTCAGALTEFWAWFADGSGYGASAWWCYRRGVTKERLRMSHDFLALHVCAYFKVDFKPCSGLQALLLSTVNRSYASADTDTTVDPPDSTKAGKQYPKAIIWA